MTIRYPNYYEQYGAKRAPAWRFEDAEKTVGESAVKPRFKLDPVTKRLRKYLIYRNRLTSQITDTRDLHRELARQFGPVWNAENIYLGGESDKSRYTLEAMILAGHTDDDIASHFGICSDTVRIYEACFFNVRDKLKHRRYICNVVLTSVFMSGLGNRTPELGCKYFGYFGGPEVLALAMDGIELMNSRPTDTIQLQTWMEAQYKLRFRTTALMSITFMEPSNYTIRSVLEGYGALMSLESRVQGDLGDDNKLVQAAQQFFSGFQAPLGSDADGLSSLPVPAYGNGAVEPRVAELQMIGVGQEPNSWKRYDDENYQNPLLQTDDDDDTGDNS